jgi:hypothetical protein
LHAITAVYGEGGLRARLLIEAGRLPGAQRDRIGAALALMSRLHERDRRQREAYSCHPLRVTIRILSHYLVTDPDVACAALLHDTVARGAMTASSAPARRGTGTCSADQPPDDTTNLPTPSPWPWAAGLQVDAWRQVAGFVAGVRSGKTAGSADPPGAGLPLT